MSIWFASVEIRALEGNDTLRGASKAFVNVAYKATSVIDLVTKIKSSFTEKNFDVCEIEDIETRTNLTIVHPDNAEKLLLLKDIEEEGYAFSWGVYHTFDEET